MDRSGPVPAAVRAAGYLSEEEEEEEGGSSVEEEEDLEEYVDGAEDAPAENGAVDRHYEAGPAHNQIESETNGAAQPRLPQAAEADQEEEAPGYEAHPNVGQLEIGENGYPVGISLLGVDEGIGLLTW
jgi:hypothetical protein